MTRFLLLVAALADIAGAQVADSTARRPLAGTVTGVVRDSVAHMPLPGATVQLVAANDPAGFVRTAVSDVYGEFVFPRIPTGKYKVGFFHPLLDSLGVDLPLREVVVTDDKGVDTELGTPSPGRLSPRHRGIACGAAGDRRGKWRRSVTVRTPPRARPGPRARGAGGTRGGPSRRIRQDERDEQDFNTPDRPGRSQ